MNRRQFAQCSSALLVLTGPAALLQAQAQQALQEGRDFTRVASPVAVPAGKVEVVEFFGYWCPHCNAFEPTLDAWVHKLPASVNFRRIPIAFQGWHEPYQRLFFAIEALGQVDALHRKVFNWVHLQKKRLEKDADILEFASANGADGAKLVDTMKSFAVAGKVRAAAKLAEGYRIDSVPTLGIQGRFMTSPSIAGSPERALAVTEALIQQSKTG